MVPARLHSRPMHLGRGPMRLGAVWLGVFALYLQLAAVAACVTGGLPGGGVQVAAGPSLFPICHAHADDDGVPPQSPHGTPCPICAVHAHGATALPAAVDLAPPAAAAYVAARPRGTITAPTRGRIVLAAAPRGPPPVA